MKSIKDINTLKEGLNNYINSDLRESLGIIILSINEKEVVIGAMNPNYERVIEFMKKIETEFFIKVLIKQIGSDEWEQKNSITNDSITYNFGGPSGSTIPETKLIQTGQVTGSQWTQLTATSHSVQNGVLTVQAPGNGQWTGMLRSRQRFNRTGDHSFVADVTLKTGNIHIDL